MTGNNFWFSPLDIQVGRDGSFKGSAKVVFMTLCTHANNDTRKCFLSVKTIAKESGYCERTVRNALHKLSELGVIEITERFSRQNGFQVSSQYRIIGHKASCYQEYGIGEVPALLDSVMPVEPSEIQPCKNLQGGGAETCIHNESLYNDIKDSLTREAPLPKPEPEPDSDSEAELDDVPDIMQPTAEYLLLKTGREKLTRSELSSLRELSVNQYPARVQKEIDKACERFRRKKHDLHTLTFNYIAGALRNQPSRRRKKAAKPDMTQSEIHEHIYSESEMAEIEREFNARRQL